MIKEPPVKKDTVVSPPPAETGDPRIKPGQLSYEGFKPNNIIFLIDISSSMQGHDRLPLLKISMETMIGQLRDIDRITIITYASKPRVLVPATPADYKEDLIKSIDTLRAAGSTSGSKGLDMAYAKAKESYINNANNQIILATDGAFDVTARDKRLIAKYASGITKKITLSTVGFGTARTDLRQLEELSEKGNGHYIYIPNREVAASAILDEIKNNSKK